MLLALHDNTAERGLRRGKGRIGTIATTNGQIVLSGWRRIIESTVDTRARNTFFPFESRGLTGVSENAIWSPDASRKVDILTFRFRTIDLYLSHEWTQRSYYINFPASLQ